jgi:hypothetical protein
MRMAWTEKTIGRHLARSVFHHKCIVLVPNCSWPGSECDVLAVTRDLRIIDIEIKISRSDLRADAAKDKWYHSYDWQRHRDYRGPWKDRPRERCEWPRRVWKHYYCLPESIWQPELLADLPAVSGVLLIREKSDHIYLSAERQAKPNRQAERLTAEQAVDIARLANLRMWDSYDAVERTNREYQHLIDTHSQCPSAWKA